MPDVYLSVFSPPDPQEQRRRRRRRRPPPVRVFFSARTLAGRWVCCWRTSEDHCGQKCRWIAPCLLPDVFTLLTDLALLLSFFSVFPQRCAEGRRSIHFCKNGGKKRKSLQCIYITSRFRKRRRERRRRRSEPPCVRHETTQSKLD